MKHLNLTPEQFCDATKACKNGREFALTQKTMADVWAHCTKAEWLLWILNTIYAPMESKQLRLFAVWCARNTPMPDGRTTGVLLTDPRSIAALEVAESYAHGMATAVELAAARAAAWAAARDAARDAERDAARAAAWAAAWAATWAAERDAARDAAWDAARAAAWAAERDAAGDAAPDAAWTAAQAAQADQLRKMIANPFAQGGRK